MVALQFKDLKMLQHLPAFMSYDPFLLGSPLPSLVFHLIPFISLWFSFICRLLFLLRFFRSSNLVSSLKINLSCINTVRACRFMFRAKYNSAVCLFFIQEPSEVHRGGRHQCPALPRDRRASQHPQHQERNHFSAPAACHGG